MIIAALDMMIMVLGIVVVSGNGGAGDSSRDGSSYHDGSWQ